MSSPLPAAIPDLIARLITALDAHGVDATTAGQRIQRDAALVRMWRNGVKVPSRLRSEDRTRIEDYVLELEGGPVEAPRVLEALAQAADRIARDARAAARQLRAGAATPSLAEADEGRGGLGGAGATTRRRKRG